MCSPKSENSCLGLDGLVWIKHSIVLPNIPQHFCFNFGYAGTDLYGLFLSRLVQFGFRLCATILNYGSLELREVQVRLSKIKED